MGVVSGPAESEALVLVLPFGVIVQERVLQPDHSP